MGVLSRIKCPGGPPQVCGIRAGHAPHPPPPLEDVAASQVDAPEEPTFLCLLFLGIGALDHRHGPILIHGNGKLLPWAAALRAQAVSRVGVGNPNTDPRPVIAKAPIAHPPQTCQTLCAPTLALPRTPGARSLLRFHPSLLPLLQRFLVCLTSGLRPCLADVVANRHDHGDMNSVKPVDTVRFQMLDVVQDEVGVLQQLYG